MRTSFLPRFRGSFKNTLVCTCLMLVALMATSYAKEEINLLISGNRDAVVKINEDRGERGAEGTVKGSADLKSGQSAFEANLKLVDTPELANSKAQAYASLTQEALEFIGKMDIKIPEEGDAPEKFDVMLDSVTEGDTSTSEFTMTVVGPATDDVPSLNFKGTLEGSVKEFNTNWTYEVASPDLTGMPFNGLEIKLTEEGDATNLLVVLKVPSGSDMAAQMGMLPMVKPMMEEKLRSVNITVDKLEIPAPKDENGVTTASIDLSIKGWRTTVGQALDGNAAAMGGAGVDGAKVAAAVKKMLEVKTKNFDLKINGSEGKLDGSFDMALVDTDRFFEGYMDILPVLVEAQKANASYADDMARYHQAYLEHSIKQSQEMFKVMIGSPLTYKGGGEFALTKTEGKAEFTGNFNVDMENYEAFVEKAKAAGLPVTTRAIAFVDISLKDKTSLGGEAYLYSDGDLGDYIKQMVVPILHEGGAPKNIEELVKEFKFEDARVSMELNGQNLTAKGFSKTSDLTPAAKEFFKSVAPQLEGDVVGVTVDADLQPEGKGNKVVNVHFANLFPGKSADETKKLLGLPSSAKVNDSASADDVKLVAVSAPEVAPAAELVAIQKEHNKSGGGIPGMPGSSGGGNSWLWILGGVLVLGMVGVGLAAGKKSA